LQPPPPSPPPLHTTLPVSAAWFDIDKVHEIEREALPEFFNTAETGSIKRSQFRKSEKMYVYYRYSIITMWRANTKKYLPPSVCRRNLLGDVCSIMRVHAFLENWGIINFPSKEIKGPLVKKDPRVECHVCSNLHFVLYTYKIDEQTFQIC
jgi:hypothetical protein